MLRNWENPALTQEDERDPPGIFRPRARHPRQEDEEFFATIVVGDEERRDLGLCDTKGGTGGGDPY